MFGAGCLGFSSVFDPSTDFRIKEMEGICCITNPLHLFYPCPEL
jgi:hypothetical protein